MTDAASVIAWAQERPRRPAHTAFTAGPERQAAYWIEWAQAAEREHCADIVRNAAKQGLCCADCDALADLIVGRNDQVKPARRAGSA